MSIATEEQQALDRGVDADAEARAASRRRASLWATASAFFVRVVSAASTMLSVPLLVAFFGQERYGVFAAVISTFTMLTLVDLGTGLGLMTAVARTVGEGDEERVRRLASAALAWCLGACGLVLAVLVVVAPFVDWVGLFNARNSFDPATMRNLVLVVATLFILQAFGNLGPSIVRGLQLGHLANGALAASALVSLAATALAIRAGAGPLGIAAAFLAPSTLWPLVLWLVVARRDVRVRPLGWPSREVIRPLIHAGLGYFALHLASVLLTQFDLVILARARGGAEVTPYAVAMRFTGAGTALLTAYLSSLWPAYSEAAARGDWGWVRHTHARSRRLATGAAVLGAAGFVVLGPILVPMLAGPEAVAPRIMYVMLGATMVLRVWTEANAYLLYGLGRVRAQVVITVSQALIGPALAVLLAGPYGASGVAAATTLGFMCIGAWATPWVAAGALRERV